MDLECDTVVVKKHAKNADASHDTEDSFYMELECQVHSYGSGWGPAAASCEHDNEPLGSIKDEFLDRLF
jgi:hypothetical protein